ncbi:hypothetical protein G0Q06_01270 [Puniceicoccales bacterium CK1056]|uniref:Uncharacterized protein n=1 Tax=Oceanipulchritudo coccoides TaxID=2706888 RepID=A0A6B2LY75_9BACT|nr:hypothetical protein [Oceanipulchritudo coccoides]NDV61072.1 hypothetical protein [Oceanipulchritudo coccoides]
MKKQLSYKKISKLGPEAYAQIVAGGDLMTYIEIEFIKKELNGEIEGEEFQKRVCQKFLEAIKDGNHEFFIQFGESLEYQTLDSDNPTELMKLVEAIGVFAQLCDNIPDLYHLITGSGVKCPEEYSDLRKLVKAIFPDWEGKPGRPRKKKT